MSFKFVKYIFLATFIGCANNVIAQTDNSFQTYLDSNVSTKSFQNQDLVFIKQILSNQRIVLQSKYDNRDVENGYDEVYKQVLLLEKAIIHYASMNHKVIVNESNIQKTGVDSELLLARLVYIKSYTWCMEESLNLRANELLESTQDSEQIDPNIIRAVSLTDNVVLLLENAKRFDRMKYSYNKKGVLEKWKYTSTMMKKLESETELFDTEYRELYGKLLLDLEKMILVLTKI